ncbi:hypothetical protein GCM10011583_55540 [Streptomyces camponoticapitis]|uniref:Uncharacterized protein n=1 Tax=Streptomyces camponoticapitis TaxID=1616125 RepID=A0ABQ2EPL3_9ACTN|nr:hypothetical protein [Streptomyces camponoticapitis]GGK16504.1 hypothetical protein GCM10011583_55540 [Streptomyces camponoticapitis]
MSRLLDACETTVSPSYRLFGLVDTTMGAETFDDDADRSKWLLPGPGLVYLQVPSQVTTTAIRLESWTTALAPPPGQWAGHEELQVDLPEGELGLQTVDGGLSEIPLVLPSPGTHRMRWQWVFNPETGPFASPLQDCSDVLPTPAGHEAALGGKDQFCLVQIWRTTAA